MQRFTATLDSLARTITFVVLLVLVIPFFTIITQYTKLHDARLLIGPAVILIGMAVLYMFRPKAYLLDSGGLRIERMIRPVLFPFHSIRSIIPVTQKELGFGVRAGSGGFLGYFGIFYYREHGKVTLYATDRSKMLLITLEGDKRIIITPDDPEGFIKAFRELNRKKPGK